MNNQRTMTVNLNFKANTESAKTNIQSLQSLLTQITQTRNIGLDSSSLGQAKSAAQELQMHLDKAVNVNTGRLDLGKFNASLKSAGSDLATLSTNLRNMGPTGQQAFMKLAKAVSAAETPMLNMSTHLANFGKTLVNTIKWTVASSLIHGVAGALQGAVTHAKDLNNALNDIRIVTGYSIDKMADFTQEARAAAKELNTTTTEYAKASLIFFQQGLTGEAVKERTDVVVKMAEVTHESVEQISSELTAIWNNFDDGTKSLEFYADAITALGAATASSSKEIAIGLEKFASIAQTVGLSYEYATASLATVVAETRQSADIVGTSFKTLFARLEGLKLGETLEDGTDLNKYSQALLTVGVNIKKANGDLKDMDTILNELGSRWDLLAQDQKVALAQAVGGMRQYSQFMALVDNWDKVQKNVEIARNSQGTLAEQQKIWSESFAAASKRVEDAKKQLYEDLVNDNALIKLNDIFAQLLGSIGNIVQSAGGIVPIILMIVGMLSNTLLPLVQNGMMRLKDNIAIISGKAQQEILATQNLMRSQLNEALNSSGLSEFQKQQILITQNLVDAKQRLDIVSQSLSMKEKMEYESKYALYELSQQQLLQTYETLEALEQEVNVLKQVAEARLQAARGVDSGLAGLGTDRLQGLYSSVTDRKEKAVIERGGLNEQDQQKYLTLLKEIREQTQALSDEQKEQLKIFEDKARSVDEALGREIDSYNKLLDKVSAVLQAQKQQTTIKGFRSSEDQNLGLAIAGNRDSDAANYYTDIQRNVKSKFGASLEGVESFDIDVSIESLSSLANLQGQYNQVAESTTAILKEIIAPYKELDLAMEEHENLLQQESKLTEEVAKAEKDLAQAVKSAKEAQDNAAKSKKSRAKTGANITAEKERQATEKLRIAQEKLVAVQEKLKNSINNQTVAQNKAKAANENWQISIEKTKGVIEAFGKQIGLSEEEMQQLTQRLIELKQGDATGLSTILDPFIESVATADMECENLVATMREILLGQGAQVDELDKLIQKNKELGSSATQAAIEEQNSLDITTKKIGLNAQAVTKLTGALSRVAMAYNGLKSIVNIWSQDDVSTMEKIMTIFMSLSMIAPVLTGGIKALNAVKAANILLQEHGTIAAAKEAVAQAGVTAATGAQTTATWALVAAKAAEWAMSGPAGWAILATSIALIGGVVAAIVQQTEVTKQHTAELKENAKAQEEKAANNLKALDGYAQETTAITEAIAAYKQLNEEEQKHIDNVTALLDKFPDLIEKYRTIAKEIKLTSEENKELANAVERLEKARALGDTQGAIKAQFDIENLLSQAGYKSALDNITSKAEQAALDNKKGHYGSATDWNYNSYDDVRDKWTVHFVGTTTNWEQRAENALLTGELRERLSQVGIGTSQSSTSNIGQQAVNIFPFLWNAGTNILFGQNKELRQLQQTNLLAQIDTNDPYSFYNFYSTVQEVYKNSELKTTELGRAFKEFLDDHQNTYDEIVELLNTYDQYRIQKTVSDLRTGAEGLDITDINSQEAFDVYYEKFISSIVAEAEKNGQSVEEAKLQAKNYLSQFSFLENYANVNSRFAAIENENVRKGIRDIYDNLSEEDKSLILKMTVDQLSSIENFKQALKILQQTADKDKIKIQITTAEDALGLLKESGMSEEDWSKIRDSVDWGAIGISFNNFIKLSYEQQNRILTDFVKALKDSSNNALKEQIKASENQIVQYEEELKALEGRRAELANSLDRPMVPALYEQVWEEMQAKNELKKQEEEYLNQLREEYAVSEQIIQSQQKAVILKAQSLEQLAQAVGELRANGGNGRQEEIAALIGLGEKYANASQELSVFENSSNALGQIQTARLEVIDKLNAATIVPDAAQTVIQKGAAAFSNILSAPANLGIQLDVSQISDTIISQSEADKLKATINELTEKEKELNAQLLKQEDILRASILVGEASEKYGLDAKEVEAQIQVIREFNSTLELSEEQIARMAIANQRMNKGVNALSEGLKDWEETLKTAVKGDADWAKVLNEVEDAVRDLIGATDDFELPADFLDAPGHMKLLEKAADGDIHAINELGAELAKTAIKAMDFNVAMANAFEQAYEKELNSSVFEEIKNSVLDGIDTIQSRLKDLENGVSLNEVMAGQLDNWIVALNEMAMATGMSVEQMNATLNQLGVQAHIETKAVKQPMWIPTYTEYSVYKENDPGEQDKETGMWIRPPGYAREHYTVPGEPMYVEGWATVAQISTEDNKLTPNIKEDKVSFTGVGGGKTGGGISKSNTTSGKKAKNSSGGKSSRDKKDNKSTEKETERYHEITKLLENYNRALNKSSQAKDRAFGPAKLKAMQAEMQAQAQINAGVEEYIREIQEWLALDKQRIAAQGAVFDKYGNIANYTALMAQHVATYNAAVAAYNSGAQDDAAKEHFQQAEKAYSDFMEQLKQYEETNKLLQEQQDALLEGLQKIYDLTTERNQYIVEFKLMADDDTLAFLDYLKNKLDNFTDGVNDAIERLAHLNDEVTRLMNKNSTYNDGINRTLQHYLGDQKGMGQSEIDAFIARFKSGSWTDADVSLLEDMSEDEFNYLREMRDGLIEVNNAFIEAINEVVETVKNQFMQTAEELEKAARPIERAANALENYAAIIDIVGRDALGITDSIAAHLDQASIDVAHSATLAAKSTMDALIAQRAEAQRLYDEAIEQGNLEMAYKWKQVFEEMDESIAQATDEFHSKWQDELTKAREAFENTVDRLKKKLLDTFAGSSGSWYALKDSLEYAQTAADRFVPQYKEIYELSKLNRDINKSIDNTSNIKSKQILRDLQKEINELEARSGEISQYDLDNARRRYELELARIQLEEARDAKSTVRLSKDSEGNWSYIYTANQDDVAAAEQNYEDKLFAMQQANNEYINSLSEQILELEEQYAEKLAEIRLDNTLSEEERNAAIERLNAFFAEQMAYLTGEGQKAVDNNARLFEEEWTVYHNWTDAFGRDTLARIEHQEDFLTRFEDTIIGAYVGGLNFEDLNRLMVEIAENASMQMQEANNEWLDNLARAMDGAGIKIDEFAQHMENDMYNRIIPSAQAAEQAVAHMASEAVSEMQKLVDKTSIWQEKYVNTMKAIMAQNELLAASLNTLIGKYAELIAAMGAVANVDPPKVPQFSNNGGDAYNPQPGGNNGGGSGNGSDGSNNGNNGSHINETSDGYYFYRQTPSTHQKCWYDKKAHEVTTMEPPKSHTWAHEHTGSTYICAICGYRKKISFTGNENDDADRPPAFATGGYTGEWNSSTGKLAILHEKELVLNKEDTKNILGTVEMVRQLSQKIDLKANSSRFAFNYYANMVTPKATKDTLEVEQTVSIRAEFPNVQNRAEIEEAFTNLINQASQYANRKS